MTTINQIDQLLSKWQNDPDIWDHVVHLRVTPAKDANLLPLPADMAASLRTSLENNQIHSLYSHQFAAWTSVLEGENIVVTTGTASGKSLCYQLPVLHTCILDPEATALFIYPTKALTYDQLQQIHRLTNALSPNPIKPIPIAVYDGDTPSANRKKIRETSRILLSNPDMLHTAVFPHHTLWEQFFQHLKFVVIDEIHIYRGVFGSHIANLIRRLKRIMNFYKSKCQFILTSATIANPAQHAAQLVESPVRCIDDDGAPHGKRYFALYNPPLVNPELGIRRSALGDCVTLAGKLMQNNTQTVVFSPTRRSIEFGLRALQMEQPEFNTRGYRSGYLPQDRRDIENGLRHGEVQTVIATNALELGIDIGNLDAALLAGYPGSIASTRQQIGRAGRKTGSALGVLVASANPLDQFLVRYPEYLFEKSPEQALIDPNNPIILLQHLRCSAFELPFQAGEAFGSLPTDLLQQYLSILVKSGELHYVSLRYYWTATRYPAQDVSLRNASANSVVLSDIAGQHPKTIGIVDYESALWMVHPGAIYLHQGEIYEVVSLDLENASAQLVPKDSDYFTDPKVEISVKKISTFEETLIGKNGKKGFGEIIVTSQVKGYQRIRWYTREILGNYPLEMPTTQLQTTGYWFVIASDIVAKLREQGLWSSDPNRYGSTWDQIKYLARKRDHFQCQVCRMFEPNDQAHHVHHKIPFRAFSSPEDANQLDNLVTLCPSCHRKVEATVRIRSGLAGLKYVVQNLAPLYAMCDVRDIGAYADPQAEFADGSPAVLLYDMVPAGIGLARKVYELHDQLIHDAKILVEGCSCVDGCPSCVGPGVEIGYGGKRETLALIDGMIQG
ncbi:MAG TPA: DEAD/DEAH box helicase [Anaerolineaceae bacterium]